MAFSWGLAVVWDGVCGVDLFLHVPSTEDGSSWPISWVGGRVLIVAGV
jgi:hypothetical protein